jgi:hypothetical protein
MLKKSIFQLVDNTQLYIANTLKGPKNFFHKLFQLIELNKYKISQRKLAKHKGIVFVSKRDSRLYTRYSMQHLSQLKMESRLAVKRKPVTTFKVALLSVFMVI